MTTAANLRNASLVFLGLLGTSSFSGADEVVLPELPGVTAGNAYFTVVADDMLSAQYVAMVGEMFGRRFSRMVPVPGGVSQPVLVDLIPASEQELTTGFLTRIHSSGQVTVSISWGEETSRALVERALAQAHLTYLSGAYSAGTVNVPLWLELASQHLTRVQAVPAHGQFLAGAVRNAGPMRMEQILTAKRTDGIDADLAPHAYWLLNFLEREARTPGQMQSFLIRLLRGETPMRAVSATFGEQVRSMEEVQLWWLVGVKDLLRVPGSPMPSAEESRRRVKDLSRFVFDSEGRELRLFVEDIWDYHTSPTLQSELRRRLSIARVEISSVHPFYHNAMLTLERVFQAVLAGDEEAFGESMVILRHDVRTGDELADDTRSILDDLAAEIGS